MVTYTAIGRHQSRHLGGRAADDVILAAWCWRWSWRCSSAAARSSFLDAVNRWPGPPGRLNAVTSAFRLERPLQPLERPDRRHVSGAGLFRLRPEPGAALSDRQSIAQSRLSLLFNAMAKIPMQFFILFIGRDGVRVLHLRAPPLLFQPVELKHVQATAGFPARAAALRRRPSTSGANAAEQYRRSAQHGDDAARQASWSRVSRSAAAT